MVDSTSGGKALTSEGAEDRRGSPKPHGQGLHVGWHVLPEDGPGTLRWWNGQDFVGTASWAADHWEYVCGDWSGTDPPPGTLPGGAVDVRESGWWAGSGHWHSGTLLPLPLPPSTSRWDPSVWFGVSGVVLESIVWLSVLLMVFVPGNQWLAGAPICLPLGFLLGAAALWTWPIRGRHRRLGRILGGVALLMGLATVGVALIFAFVLMMSMGDTVL